MTPTARATRARILAGAGRAFARLGIRQTSVRDINEETECSRRTFYLYFANQDLVLQALYGQAMDDMLASLVRAVAAAPDDPVGAGVEAYLDFHQSQGELLTVLMSEAMATHSPLSAQREGALQRFEQTFGAATERARGYRLDPLLYRALFTGLGTMVLSAKRDGRIDPADRPRLARVMRAMIGQVLSAAESFPDVKAD